MYLNNLWDVLLELAPWLLLGAAVAGVLHVLVPEGLIHRQLRGPSGVVKAVLFGIPLPLCSCGVIPAGIGLKREGASNGSAIAFLTATPQTGVDSILVSASFLGWPFALTKVGAALVTGLAAGWITEAVDPGDSTVEQVKTGHEDRSLRGGLHHAVDLVRMIWRWLVFGVVVSAALTTWLPTDFFSGLTGMGSALTFAAVLGLSLPLYVCATASVPIAAALVAGGMPTGAALAFLMAGPATNVATLGAVRKGFGWRALAIYLTTIVAGSIAFGLGYEAVFGALVSGASGGHVHTAWYSQGAALVLVGMLTWFAWEEVVAMTRNWNAKGSEQTVMKVEGMTCNGCASRLQRVLQNVEGVEAAEVSFDLGRVVVTGPVPLARIEQAVRGAGFDPA